MICSSCSSEIAANAKFCPDCGVAQSLKCPSCAHEYKPGAKFCAECGTALSAQKPASAPADNRQAASDTKPAHSGERRQLTVMFCDIVGSTELAERIDAEDMLELMRTYQEACAKIVTRYEGHLAKYMGDGMLVNFGYPTAHEDDAQRAVRAGLGMVEAIKAISFRTAKGELVPIAIRIGIHTGEVVVDEIGAEEARSVDIVGQTPNIAARIQSLAKPNTVCITDATSKLIQGYFHLEELEKQNVKGVSKPVTTFRVIAESGARTRMEASVMAAKDQGAPRSQMIGREEDFATLKRSWQLSKESDGQVVLLSGEGGIGKSRLVEAIREHVVNDQDGWLTEIYCSPYHKNSAFYPIIQLFERVILQFKPEDSTDDRYTRLEAFLLQAGVDVDASVPLMAPLLSLPPNPKYRPLEALSMSLKQRTMELLMTLLLRRSQIQPVLFIAEDLHWADPSTLELIGLVADQVPTHKLLCLLTFRPEFEPQWKLNSNTRWLRINKLAKSEIKTMLLTLTAQKEMPQALQEQILKKTDGIPLFIEELTKTVLEAGLLVDQGDRYEYTGNVDEAGVPTIDIPSTLKDSLMARLDRLSTSKLIAQIGAVLGREFSYQLLRSLTSRDTTGGSIPNLPIEEPVLRHELTQLVGAELLYQKGLPPNSEYIFKHALIQDAAYSSLLNTRRQAIHRQAANILRENFADIAQVQPELIAHHLTEAKQIAEAIPEWLRAGQLAVTRSANLEAVLHFERGLELLESLPAGSPGTEHELALRLSLGSTLISTKGYSSPDVQKQFSRAHEICQLMADPDGKPSREMGGVLWGLWGFYLVRGELQTAYDYAQEFLKLARDLGDLDLELEASSLTVISQYWFAEFDEVKKLTTWIEQNYDPEKHGWHAFQFTQDPRTTSRCYKAWSEYLTGHPAKARQTSIQNIEDTRKLNHAYSLGYALVFDNILAAKVGDDARIMEIMDEAYNVSASNSFPIWIADCLIHQGYVKARASVDATGIDEGIALLDQGLGIWKMVGGCLWQTHTQAMALEACIKGGDLTKEARYYDRAWQCVEEIERIQRENREVFYQPETLRLKGELILSQYRTGNATTQAGPTAQEQAEELFAHSIELARRFKARMLEVKTACSLWELVRGTEREPTVLEQIDALASSIDDDGRTPVLTRAKQILSTTATVN